VSDPRGYRPRLPDVPPSTRSLAEQAAFEELSRQSLSAVRQSAEAWRNGSAGLLALVTTGVVVSGRDLAAGLAAPWRAAVSILIVVGIALTLVGLWQALGAQAGTRARRMSLTQIRRIHGSLDGYRLWLADEAANRLRIARLAIASALVLLLAGVVLSWWAPAAPTSPPAYFRVQTSDGVICGELESADGGTIRLLVKGEHATNTIPMSRVTNLGVVRQCQ
jgi:hypothetical protein